MSVMTQILFFYMSDARAPAMDVPDSRSGRSGPSHPMPILASTTLILPEVSLALGATYTCTALARQAAAASGVLAVGGLRANADRNSQQTCGWEVSAGT